MDTIQAIKYIWFLGIIIMAIIVAFDFQLETKNAKKVLEDKKYGDDMIGKEISNCIFVMAYILTISLSWIQIIRYFIKLKKDSRY